MFYDLEYKKRFPAIYALINNKKYEGYDYLFKKIKNIITLENTRQIKIKSFSTDFESALLNEVKNNFSNIRGVGCYFHYCKLIVSHIKKYKLKKIKDFNYNIFLYEITNIPFIKDNLLKYLESIPKKYRRIKQKISEFLYDNSKYSISWPLFI